MLSPLSQKNLRDQALEILKLRLISGDLAPGQIYSASSLATELGVSNSPVREAMLTLVNQGLMETVRNRGFRVVPLSQKELRNIYDLRVLIEIPSTARLAEIADMVRSREAEFAALAEKIVSSAETADIVSYLDADRSFHIGLLEMLDNEHLVAIVGNLRDQSRHYGLKALSDRGTLVDSAKEHMPILRAIVAGDYALTAKLMSAHMSHLAGDWSSMDALNGA